MLPVLNSEFVKAFISMQKELPAIKKDADNPFFKSKYAALENILDVVMPILHKHGFMVTHEIKEGYVATHLYHEFGQLSSCFPMPQGLDAQKVGSLITYARRYTLVGMLGLNISGEDDDGNAASQKKEKPPLGAVKEMPPKSRIVF